MHRLGPKTGVTRAGKAAALMLLLASGTARAVDPGVPLASTALSAWRVEDGLPHGVVRQPVQDRDGYLWFGTQGGLVRYDGKRLTVHQVDGEPGLASNAVGPVLADPAGRIWVGTREGLSVVDRGRVRAAPFALPKGPITALLVDRAGSLWVAVYGQGLFQWSNGTLALRRSNEQLPAGSALALHQSLDGAMWVGTTLGGAARIAGTTTTMFGTAQGLPHAQVTGFATSKDGTLLAATDGGMAAFDGRGFHRWRPDLPSIQIGLRAVMVDRAGATWLASSEGLLRVGSGGVERLTVREGLSNDVVTAIYEDREGNVWAATRDGLNRVSDAVVRHVSIGVGDAEPEIGAVCRDGAGTLWVSTNGAGIHASADAGDRRTPRFRKVADAPGGGPLACLAGGGTLFVGNDQRITRFDGIDSASRLVATLPESPSHRVLALLQTADGVLWAGTNGAGVLVRRGDGWSTITKADGLPDDVVVSLAQDAAGRVWAGTQAGAVALQREKVVAPRAGDDMASAPFVWSFLRDRAGMWAGSDGGLLRSTAANGGRSLSSREGLGTESVHHLALDAEGGMWVVGGLGIAHIDHRQLEDYFTGARGAVVPSRLGPGDGLRGAASGSFQPRGWTDADGLFWFVTTRGLAVVDLTRTRRVLPPLAPRVERVQLGDGKPLLPLGTVSVAAGVNRLALELSAPRLTAPERVRMRYRMTGLDSGWIAVAPGVQRVEYTNLAPGRYRFELEASDDGTHWSPARSALEVRKLPAPHQTWWFAMLVALSTVAVASLAYLARLRHVESRHALLLAERSRLARELHDTLLQSMGAVTLQLHAIERTLGAKPEAVPDMVQALIESASRSMVEARDAVWDLRVPGDGTLGASLARLVDDARARPGAPGVTLNVATGVDLRPEVRIALQRVAEESLLNALTHSGADAIDLSVSMHGSDVELEVRDDGCGFTVRSDRAGLGGHWGVLGMHERMQRVGGSLRIESAVGQGTRVIARVST